MPKRWKDEQDLLDQLSNCLVTAMSTFPKRMVRIDELVHMFHMPFSHIQILSLVEQKDCSIGQLSEHLGIAKPNITPLVDALNARGMVERIRSEKDRRIVQVHILPPGEDCLKEIRGAVAGQLARWPDTVSKSDVRELLNALAALQMLTDKL